jgi:hypothetical protein
MDYPCMYCAVLLRPTELNYSFVRKAMPTKFICFDCYCVAHGAARGCNCRDIQESRNTDRSNTKATKKGGRPYAVDILLSDLCFE